VRSAPFATAAVVRVSVMDPRQVERPEGRPSH
jgi:hypothetical protein